MHVSLNAIREGVAPNAEIQGRGDDGAGSEESIGIQPSGGEVVIRGFDFKWLTLVLTLTLTLPISLVEFQRSGGLGYTKREDGRAVFARLPFCLSPQAHHDS